MLNTETMRYVPAPVDKIQILGADGEWHNWKNGGLMEYDFNAKNEGDFVTYRSYNTATITFEPIYTKTIGTEYCYAITNETFEPGMYEVLKYNINRPVGDTGYMSGSVDIISAENTDVLLKQLAFRSVTSCGAGAMSLADITVPYKVRIKNYGGQGTQTFRCDELKLTNLS